MRSSYIYSKVPVMSSTYAQSIAVGKESEIGSYMPTQKAIQQALAAKHYPDVILELRGQVMYRDDNDHTYYLPYCYVVHEGKPLPVSQECNDAGDDILK